MSRQIGERIVLREFRQEDISGIRSWVNDHEVTQYLSAIFLRPHTWEQSESYLSGLLNGDVGGVNLVIAERESLRYLGQCNLLLIEQRARKAELAIVMCKEHQGKGYGAEAISLLLRYAFMEYNLNRVYLRVDARNERAVALYERLGFQHEGRLRADEYNGGEYRDTLMMSILRGEYMEAKKRP